MAAVLSQQDLVAFLHIRIVHFQHDVFAGIIFPAIKRRHLPGKNQRVRFFFCDSLSCFCTALINPPACVSAGFKNFSRQQELVKLFLRFSGNTAFYILLSCLFYIRKIFVSTHRQFWHPKQLALTAKNGRIISPPAEMIEKAVYAVIVSFRCIKATSGNHHCSFSTHVISGGMISIPDLSLLFFHEGKKHGQLTVNKVF